MRRRGGRRVAVSGRLRLPKGVKPAQACGSGRVLVRIGKQRRSVRLRSNCSFAAVVKLAKRRRAVARRYASAGSATGRSSRSALGAGCACADGAGVPARSHITRANAPAVMNMNML